MSDEVLVNPNLDNGREHRVGADLYDWEYNNTYDIDNVVPDVKLFIDQTYTRSITAQGELCNISRMYGSMADFRRDVEVNRQLGLPYYSYTLEIPIKNIRCFKNLALRRANPRIYTIHDSCQMTDMFESRVMMFINGEYYPAVKFYASPDRFILIIGVNNGELSLNHINNWIRSGATWSLLSMPFSTVKYKYGLTSTLIKNGIIPLASLDKVSNAMYVKRNLWLVSVGTVSGESGLVQTTLATMVTAKDGTVGLKLNDTFAGNITSTYVSIEATAIPNVKGGLLLGTGRAFQIELDDNPIPPQNVMCWETDATGSYLKYLHNTTVTLHYPNVYTVDNVDSTTNLYVTWCYSDENTAKFYNPLAEYMQYNASYAADVINGNLPAAIRRYIPYKSEYTEPNYLDYFDQATRRNEYTFKFETLKDLISDDTRRLEKLYVDNVIRTAYKWHSNPRFTIKASEWGSFAGRIRRNNSQEVEFCTVEDFGTECIYFTMDHEDERSYPVAVWVNGLRCMKIWQYTEKFRSYIYIPRELIDSDSIIEIEVMKTRDDSPTTVTLELGDKHNSVLIPDDFLDISPQNILVAVQEDTSDVEEDGSYQHIYRVAPNYEMYWLLIGNIEYKNGVPVGYTYDGTKVNDTTVITTQDDTILDENGNAITAGTGNLWTGGSTHYLSERGRKPSYIQVPDEQFPEDYNDLVKVRALGYYNDERRRFFEYMPNGEDDAPIYITPITNYFANKTVKITNTDIQKTWKFVITPEDKQIKIKDFTLDPTSDKFRVYLNGRLLDAYHDYIMDASLPNGFYLHSIVSMAITAPFIGKADVLVEYIPYRYTLLYRLTNVRNNCIELRTASIKRPFSLVYYDVYLNGKKLYAEDVIIKSPSKIIINTPVIGGTLSFYERAHDPDIYDNDYQMRKALIDQIADQDASFKKWLLPNLDTTQYGGIATASHSASVSCGTECVSACISGCANLCGTACSGACTTGCVGSCIGSCANEAASNACAGCGAGCASTCYGCTNTCAANCGSSADTYAGACSGCDGLCNDNCAASTAAVTSVSCAGCAASCGETCTDSCVGTVTSNARNIENVSSASSCAACASSCLSTCMGDCSGTVTSAACSGCAGTCINECGGCSGNCTGSTSGRILTTCDACSASCTTSCSENCGTSCYTSCIGNCIGCAGTCDNECTEGCLGGCTGGCESNCSSTSVSASCASCNGSCESTSTSKMVTCAGCYTSCSTTCGITCGIGCGASCANASSSTGLSASCNTACSSNCDTSCTGTCSEACSSTCKGTCAGDCDTSCKGTSTDVPNTPGSSYPACSACDTSCSTVCSLSCSGTSMSATNGCSGCDTNCYTLCSSTCKNNCEGECSSNSCTFNCSTACSGCSSVASAEASQSCTACDSQCTGCSSTCTTNCGSGCSGGCSGCTGSCTTGCDVGCKLTCTSCSSNCFGSCTNGCGTSCSSSSSSLSSTDCSGCDATCATDCEGLCSTTCSTGCSTTCSAECGTACGTSCSGNCSEGCYGTCATSCSTTCTDTCSATCTGCGLACSDGCAGSCVGYADSNTLSCKSCGVACSSTCDIECVSQCQNSCREVCSNSCGDTCSNRCSSNCVGDCSSGCSTGCTGTCQESCTGNCATSCSGTCTGSSASTSNSGSCSGCSSSCAGMSSGMYPENNIRNITYGQIK